MVKKNKLTPGKKKPKPKKMTSADFIKWRNGMGLTQDGAAKLLGFKHRSSINHIEKGRKAITAQIAMLCEMFKEKAR